MAPATAENAKPARPETRAPENAAMLSTTYGNISTMKNTPLKMAHARRMPAGDAGALIRGCDRLVAVQLYRRHFRRWLDGAVDDRAARDLKDAEADDADGDQRPGQELRRTAVRAAGRIVARRHPGLALRLVEHRGAGLCAAGLYAAGGGDQVAVLMDYARGLPTPGTVKRVQHGSKQALAIGDAVRLALLRRVTVDL